MIDIITLLTDQDDKKACDMAKQMAFDSEFSKKYYEALPEFASLLGHKKSYVRTRAFILCASQAKWDTKGKIKEILPQMFPLFHDEKPTVVRQCLNAIKEVVVFRPELKETIRKEISTIDVSVYKDSMSPLIKKDMEEVLELIQEEPAL